MNRSSRQECRLGLSLGQISTSETMLMDCGLMDLIPTRIPYLIIPLELYDRSLLWQRVYYTHREINKRNPYQIEEELHWFDLCLPCSCTRSLLSDISSHHITSRSVSDPGRIIPFLSSQSAYTKSGRFLIASAQYMHNNDPLQYARPLSTRYSPQQSSIGSEPILSRSETLSVVISAVPKSDLELVIYNIWWVWTELV